MKEKVSEKMLYFAKGKNKTKILIFFFSEKNHFFVSIKKLSWECGWHESCG